MPFQVRYDEQIKVGTTTGLVAGTSSFTFDGTGGKPNYLNYEIVPSELNGRGILILNVDYSWDYVTGHFQLLQAGDAFQQNQYYNIHFEIVPPSSNPLPPSLIDAGFFIRDISVPNTSNPAILERLNAFIEKYEKECLVTLMGYELYELFIVNYNEPRMSEIIGGGLYTVNGVQYKWQGLVYDINNSLLAYYVYYYFQSSSATQTLGVSTSTIKTESGVSVSPADKMMEAWNNYSRQSKNFISFLWYKEDANGDRLYPEVSLNHLSLALNLSRTNNIFGI